ncbi:MAG: 2-oxo acid dehydrogenase subunit E2, partial [Rikenellaceae bacterium]|nr:2-oxo acid dehydrogenase subunit E2 [Rikenellaceae bacterium]
PAPAPAGASAPAAAGPVGGISPRARGLAEKYGVDTSAVAGSGPGGRIIARDVIASIECTPKTTPLAKAQIQQGGVSAPAQGTGLGGAVCSRDLAPGSAPAAASAPAPQATSDGDGVIKPLTNMRKLIAKAMHASLQNSAQLTHHLGADARRILELRKAVKKAGGANITLNDMVCFAVIRALKKFPQVNSHFLGDSMKYFNRVHLGLAVDTDRGLMVPALRDADMLSLEGLGIKLREMAEACRKGSVNPDILSPEAASFTVSNLGNYGVEVFTPVINLPQSAILGVNTILPRPKDIGNGIYAFVPHIGLSLTYDHRALDGGEATRFLAEIASQIENFEAAI